MMDLGWDLTDNLRQNLDLIQNGTVTAGFPDEYYLFCTNSHQSKHQTLFVGLNNYNLGLASTNE